LQNTKYLYAYYDRHFELPPILMRLVIENTENTFQICVSSAYQHCRTEIPLYSRCLLLLYFKHDRKDNALKFKVVVSVY